MKNIINDSLGERERKIQKYCIKQIEDIINYNLVKWIKVISMIILFSNGKKKKNYVDLSEKMEKNIEKSLGKVYVNFNLNYFILFLHFSFTSYFLNIRCASLFTGRFLYISHSLSHSS